MKAIIPAAGKGTRLLPLTLNTPKPMLKLWGKPILEYILNGLKKLGIYEVVIITGYLGEKIENYFKYGERLGLKINYQRQLKQKGTGHAILQTEKFIIKNEPFILLWCDILTDYRIYKKIINEYNKEKTDVLMGVNWVLDPAIGAAIYTDKEDNITKIVQKPLKGTSNTHYNQVGISIYNHKIFNYLKKIKLSNRGEYELESALSLMIDSDEKVRSYPINDKNTQDIIIDITDLKVYKKFQEKEEINHETRNNIGI